MVDPTYFKTYANHPSCRVIVDSCSDITTSIARDLAKQDEMPHKNIYARRVAAVKNEKDGKAIRKDIEKDAANGKDDAKQLEEMMKK